MPLQTLFALPSPKHALLSQMIAGTLSSGLSQQVCQAVQQEGCRLPASWMALTLGKRKGEEGWGHLYPGLGETGDKSGSHVVKTGMRWVIKRKGRTRIKLKTGIFSLMHFLSLITLIQQKCIRIRLYPLASPEFWRKRIEAINCREKWHSKKHNNRSVRMMKSYVE